MKHFTTLPTVRAFEPALDNGYPNPFGDAQLQLLENGINLIIKSKPDPKAYIFFLNVILFGEVPDKTFDIKI